MLAGTSENTNGFTTDIPEGADSRRKITRFRRLAFRKGGKKDREKERNEIRECVRLGLNPRRKKSPRVPKFRPCRVTGSGSIELIKARDGQTLLPGRTDRDRRGVYPIARFFRASATANESDAANKREDLPPPAEGKLTNKSCFHKSVVRLIFQERAPRVHALYWSR